MITAEISVSTLQQEVLNLDSLTTEDADGAHLNGFILGAVTALRWVGGDLVNPAAFALAMKSREGFKQ